MKQSINLALSFPCRLSFAEAASLSSFSPRFRQSVSFIYTSFYKGGFLIKKKSNILQQIQLGWF